MPPQKPQQQNQPQQPQAQAFSAEHQQLAQQMGIDLSNIPWRRIWEITQFLVNVILQGGHLPLMGAQGPSCPPDDSHECCRQAACHALQAAQICLAHVEHCEKE